MLYRKKLTSLLTGRDLEQDPPLAQVELQHFLKVIFVFHYYRKVAVVYELLCKFMICIEISAAVCVENYLKDKQDMLQNHE